MKKKTVVITLIAAVLTAASAAAVILMNSESGKIPIASLKEHSISHFFTPKEARTRFLADSDALDENIAGNIDAYLSVDGTVEAVRAATALYRADADGILLIHPAAVDKAVLSLNNRYLLFNTASKLFVYDHALKKCTELKGVPKDNGGVRNLVISPGGMTYAVSVSEKDDAKLNTYICINSSPEISNDLFRLYKEDSCVCAVSDDGEIAYYAEAEGMNLTNRLYYVKNGRDKLIAENIEANFEITRNLREITFDIDNKTYCSINGDKPRLLTGASCFSNAGKCYSVMGGELLDVRLKDTDTLLNSVFYTYYPVSDARGDTYAAYDLYYVNSFRHGVTIAKGATQFSVSPDEKELLVLVDTDLCSVSVYRPKEHAVVFKNVYTYCSSADLKDIYAVDTKAALWHISRQSKNDSAAANESRLIARNVLTCLMSGDGVCFFVSNYDAESKRGKLKCVKDGVKGGKPEIVAEDITYFEILPGAALYYVKAGGGLYDVYACSGGSEFKRVIEKAKIAGE